MFPFPREHFLFTFHCQRSSLYFWIFHEHRLSLGVRYFWSPCKARIIIRLKDLSGTLDHCWASYGFKNIRSSLGFKWLSEHEGVHLFFSLWTLCILPPHDILKSSQVWTLVCPNWVPISEPYSASSQLCIMIKSQHSHRKLQLIPVVYPH